MYGKVYKALFILSFMKKRKVTLSLDDKVYSDFQNYCEENAIMLSKKVEIFIKEFLKNKKILSAFFMLFLSLFLISFVSAEIVERGSNWNKISNPDGSYSLEIYNNIINFDNGSAYLPADIKIIPSNHSSFTYEVANASYKAYFKNNTNIPAGVGGQNASVRFENRGYFFTFDISTSQMKWYNSTYVAGGVEIGMVQNMNPQNTQINVSGNSAYYSNAWLNTDLEYKLNPDTMKETLIIRSVPNPSSSIVPDYFQYRTNLWFNSSLMLCADGICYSSSSGSAKNIDTWGKIEFRDSDNKTIFYLPTPIVSDSIGNTSLGYYSINLNPSVSNPIILLKIRILKSFLNNATFPVYLDPSVRIGGSEGGGDAYVASGNPNQNFGTDTSLEVKKQSPTRSSYVMFNISSIPDNQVIDNASLCMYIYEDVIAGAETIYIHHVYNTSWCEGDGGTDGNPACEITWNNQPCGTNFDDSENCNLTAESNVTNDGNQDNTWECWDIKKSLAKAYLNGSEAVALVLVTNDSGSADKFRSKEYSNSSLWPYLNITYHLSDMIAPSFSIYTENPANGSSYAQGQIYRFNVTINENNMNIVGIEFNGTNYTNGITNVSNVYIFNRTDLAAGTYYYRWWANDSVGNYNTSEIRYYTINKAIPVLTFLANGVTENLTLTYSQQVNISARADYGTVGLDKDGANYLSNNGLNVTLAARSYIFRANITGNQNYTDVGYSYYNVTINKASQTALLTINETSPITYGVYINVTCNGNLYRDNNLINSEKSQSVLLGAGSYNYSCQLPENQNYSYNDDNQSFVVDKANPSLNMNITGTSPIIYGNVSDFNGTKTNSGDDDCVYSLDKSNGIYRAGTWTFNYSTSGCMNYTAGSVTRNLDVEKADPNLNLTLSSNNVFYGISTTATGSNCPSQLACTLYRNGAGVSNPDTQILGVGNYAYIYSTLGNQNYTPDSTADILTVSKSSTTTSVLVSPSPPLIYGTESNFSCSNSASLETLLYINGINKTNEKGENLIRAVGNYTLNCTFAGNDNYTSSSDEEIYVINKAEGNISLFLNGQENDIEIDYPQQYNITATTLYGNIAIYFNGEDITSNNSLNLTPERVASYYNITAVSSGDENHSSSSIIRWLNVTLDVMPPLIEILSPQQDATYGYNESIPLEFSVSDKHLESCWFNLDGGENIFLSNCQNTTFNVSGNGIYTIYVYANDSLGNLGSNSINFSVNIGSPTITLFSPINSYLRDNNVAFVYVPSDIDLESCELWGDFNGSFSLNQVNNLPLNYSTNNFSLVLEDGTYIWNIRCNDSQEHYTFNGNKTFHVDTLAPILSINQPKGTQTSKTGIPIQFSIIDASPTTCWYNVRWSTGQEVLGNTTIANCSSTSFNLSADGDYILSFFAKDFANNINFTSSSFSVSTSQPPIIPPGGGGGSSGGGGIVPIKNVSGVGKLQITKLSNLIVNPGESKKLVLSVKNIGTSFLNDCKIKGKGNNSAWIFSEEVKGLSAGEIKDFVFTLSMPEKLGFGSYNLEVTVECQEDNKSISFNAEIIERKLAVDLINIERTSRDKVKIIYSLAEISGYKQEVKVEIDLLDYNNEKLAEKKENKTLNANSEQTFEAVLEISPSLAGSYNLLINAISETSSTSLQEEIILGGSPVGGLAIFGKGGADTYISIILGGLFVVFAIFIARRILKLRKLKKEKIWDWNIKKGRFEKAELKKNKA